MVIIVVNDADHGIYTITGDVSESQFANRADLRSIDIKECSTIGEYGFFNCTNIKDVKLPNTLTKIGTRAFSDCSLLNKITIPDGVSTIEAKLFYFCTSLEEVTLPQTLVTIGNESFRFCTSLKNLRLPSSLSTIGKSAFSGCTNLTLVNQNLPNNLRNLGNGVFSTCSKFTNITIPDSITVLGSYLFNQCNSLQSVAFGPSITHIGDYCFFNCYNLVSISDLPIIESIGDRAFDTCSNLRLISLSNEIKSIGISAFKQCEKINTTDYTFNLSQLTEIKAGTFSWALYNRYHDYRKPIIKVILSDKCKKIGNYAFYMDEVYISLQYVEYIGDYAFYKCNILEFSDSIKYIGNSAFYGCGFRFFNLPKYLTNISSFAFAYGGCYESFNLNIPNCVTHIYGNAFQEWYFDQVTIPSSVEYIDKSAFQHTLINSFHFENGCKKLGKYCFANSGITSMVLPDTLLIINESVFYDSKLGSITFPKNLQKICKYAFMFEHFDKYYNIEGDNVLSFIFHDSLRIIEEKAFYWNIHIKRITFFSSNLTIGDYAFYRIGGGYYNVFNDEKAYLDSKFDYQGYAINVTFCHTYSEGEKVKIGKNAFQYAWINIKFPPNMDTISDYCFTSAYIFDLEIPNTITKIGNYAFSRAVFKPFSTQNLNRNLEFGTSTFAYTSIENFTLPSGILFVNPGLFSCCQYLKSIQIPHVDYIGKYAFFNCSSLEHVYINYGCKEIGEFAFSQSGINSITFPDSITKIGSNAFSHCINLKIFSVPKNLISVQYQTFVNCTNITSIDLHHVSSISSLAFYHCINLIKIIIPRNCKIVNSYAFSDCLSLCTVIICQKVTTNPFSFSNCTNLSLIIFKETSTIKNYTFTNCTSIQHIVLNQSVGFDEFPFDESLQNKIDLYYLSSTLRFSVNIGLYIHNVTALDTFMNPKFFGFTPTKVSNTTMNETIFSLDCAPEIDFSDDYVSNEDKITITAGIIPVKHKIHIDVNNGFVICKVSLFNALSAVNIFLDLKKIIINISIFKDILNSYIFSTK